ncbi:hypothetical protein B0H10DRAFT_2357696, partial [Mycena sp. CBHHK59/15]
ATAVIKLIDSGSHGTFWSGVERVNRYLTPLAVAANITQGANTRLDHVVITLAMLHRLYSTSSSFEYPADNQAICESLEKRWRALKHARTFTFLPSS